MSSPIDNMTVCLRVGPNEGLPGPYVDGDTQGSNVRLSPDVWGIFTGTHWKVEPLDNDDVALHCCGDQPGNVYLGASQSRGVFLASDTSDPGTHWYPAVQDQFVELDARYLNPPIDPSRDAWLLGVLAPYGGYQKDTVGLSAQRGSFFDRERNLLATTFLEVVPVQQTLIGRTVVFGYLWVQNPPQYMAGRAEDYSVWMMPNTGPLLFGTRWTVIDNGDGTVLFQCQGNGPVFPPFFSPYLQGNDGGSVSLTFDAGARGTRWTVGQDPPKFDGDQQIGGGYYIQCVDQPDSYLAAYDRSMDRPVDLAVGRYIGLAVYWQLIVV